ncbi:hypothetical protein [Asticcacaulis solisilvae]|uniref:hypothetical protein n=1 Tax=Asticcacaulis solisilvae TaxID=1217274 RepID=UPI003FD7DF61
MVVLAGGAMALPARAQTLGLAPSHDVSPWRIVGALLFCCALGAAGAFALRYRMRTGAGPAPARTAPDWRRLVANFRFAALPAAEAPGRLKLVETVRLGYQVEVNLMECDGKTLVIVTSPHGAFVADPDAPGKSGIPS